MFNNVDLLLPFLKLNYYNLYFLFFFLSVFVCLLMIFNNYQIISVTDKPIFFKNGVLFIFTTSFIVFIWYLNALVYFKNYLAVQNLVFYDYTYNYMDQYVLDLSSIIILFLCYIIGLISIITLGDRFWAANYKLVILFIYFIIIVNLLVQSTALFELFIYYELLLLPSIFFVYKSGYTKKSQQANIYFFIWTQIGSLLVFFGVSYVSMTVGSTQFSVFKKFTFTDIELYVLYLLFFFGFGVKVPLWPTHFWLIKVHVEAPSGFSIFLSGFLVKSAIYCFYKIILILDAQSFFIIPVFFCILGMMDASLKMWAQTDIKKLIAYATVQEMNAIYLLFNMGDSWAVDAGLIFVFAHGILSTLMFYLVECIYKRYHSRSLYKVYGISQLFPNLGIAIWGMLIVFFGFPGTLKFYAELQLCMYLANNSLVLALFVAFVFIFVGAVGFARCWFSVLYGHPGDKSNNVVSRLDLTVEEALIICLLLAFSTLPLFFIYLF